MKMYGVFSVVPAPTGQVGDLSKEEYAAKLAESDKNPVAFCRYADEAQRIVKGYSGGAMEVRDVDIATFDIVARRTVTS